MFEGEKSKILPIFACKVVVSQFFHFAFGETGGGGQGNIFVTTEYG
jgi:hypothetical protein